MKILRFCLLFVVLCGSAIVLTLYKNDGQLEGVKRSFQVLFLNIGKPIKSVDRAVTQISAVSDQDEKKIGLKINETLKKKEHSEYQAILDEINKNDYSQKKLLLEKAQESKKMKEYLNTLIKYLAINAKKPFQYEVFLSFHREPNAYAAPGGNIVITKSLIDLLKSESELVAILAHEMGHIERNHLLDNIRSSVILSRLFENDTEEFSSSLLHSLAEISFSKTQEDEADEYAFRLLVDRGYDPFAISLALDRLLQYYPGSDPGSILGDFIISHPNLELRVDKFNSKALLWKSYHKNTVSYLGVENLQQKTPCF